MQGRVIAIGEPTGGTSKAGKDWTKQGFVIDDEAKEYPKKLSFDVMNDKTNMFETLRVGQMVEVDFNVESNEYNGKFYTNAKAFKATAIGGQESSVKQSSGASQTGASGEIRKDGDSEDDLPFRYDKQINFRTVSKLPFYA
jgi:hypothetical protein